MRRRRHGKIKVGIKMAGVTWICFINVSGLSSCIKQGTTMRFCVA